MSHCGAKDGLGSTPNQGVGGALKGCSGCTDIIDEKHTVAHDSTARREASAGELHPPGTGPPRLPAESVPTEGRQGGPFDGLGYLGCDQPRGARASTQAAETV